MSNNKIEQSLLKLFEKHRIVFWYDAEKELREDYHSQELAGVEKVEINNNEYKLKYKILRECPEQKFLLYHEGPQPLDIENWLLDVMLAHGEFRADQTSIWLSELDLGPEFMEIGRSHKEFFNSDKRRIALKRLLKEDNQNTLKKKMLAVCASSDDRIDSILENLLSDLAQDKDEKIKLIQYCKLDTLLWDQVKRHYGYISQTPSIKDFTISLFSSCYQAALGEKTPMNNEAIVFLKRWKDSRTYQESFEGLSAYCEDILKIENDLAERDYRDLIEIDYYRIIDTKILSELVKKVTERTISTGECTMIVRQRRQSHWYEEFRLLYEAIDYGAQFLQAMQESSLEISSLQDGIDRYARTWYKLDQFYRKYIVRCKQASQITLMEKLTEKIENLYSNEFLLRINNNWQQFVDKCTKWDTSFIFSQNQFFNRKLEPFLKKDNKVFVIISDGFRYEIGEDLISLIRQEDRYEATLDPMVSVLPSYTQLGMAALLPHKQLAFADNDTGTVITDGQSSQGSENRRKILEQAITGHSSVLKADDFLALNKEDARTLFRDNEVVYIYHNRIDAMGDKKESEDRVFEAVDNTLEDLIKIIKKSTGANWTNIIVTADHGFIYQNRELDDSDYTSAEPTGTNILFQDRRFVLGKGLIEHSGLKKFTAQELGLGGDMEVQIPKSINRMRRKGSGSRYVHGGASLQEIVVPVISINKKKKSDLSAVEVEILRSGSSVISSGQVSVAFYQVNPVADKIQPRILKAGIYTKAGELISDQHDLLFDFTSENAREREIQVRFLLTRKADEVNGQEVAIKLREQIVDTTRYEDYKVAWYRMQRSFTTDFDF